MRLDVFLLKNGYFDSRTKARQAIERKEIFINGKQVDKVAYEIDENKNQSVEWICEESFVSLGGYKLKKALSDFNLSVGGFCVADIGASTGGFTDCLLKNGAKKVFAVDLNDGLLHESLKKDKRVVSIIKNARELNSSDFNERLDLIVADLSFISVAYVMPVFERLMDNNCKLIILIKPQFETGGKTRFKNGIIRDSRIHKEVCKNVFLCARENGLIPIAFTTSPILENKNTEFLLLLGKNCEKSIDIEDFYVE